MIFMSQSGITEPAQQAAWDHWYQAHLVVMPVFRISLCGLRHFCIPLEVLYNLLTRRGDCDACPPIP